MSDEVVTEVRRIRERYVARFNFDLDAIYRHLKEKEQESGRHYVSFVRDRKKRSGARAERRGRKLTLFLMRM
jgi:hypothetical protein